MDISSKASASRTAKAKVSEWQATNRRCAGLILANPGKYGGEGSLMVRWSRLVMPEAGHEPFNIHPDEMAEVWAS